MSTPNPICHTLYINRTIGLTVTAYPNPQPGQGGWLVRFLRCNTRHKLLDKTALWLPRGGWDCLSKWAPIRHRLIPPAALSVVEAWLALAARAAEVVQ
jgi:hypothetical protein